MPSNDRADERVTDRVVVTGGHELSGTVTVGGAKNSVLKLMAATLMAPGRFELSNVPAISDVSTMGELLATMGAAWHHPGGDISQLVIDSPDEPFPEAPFEQAESIRASISVLGPLLARCGRARVPLPGGDNFGTRPVDIHLRGLAALGAEIELVDSVLVADATSGLRGARITLDFPSVGATENIVMAAVGAKGASVLDNVAREPEIVDLCNMLNEMGAQIEGVGSATLTVHGVPIPDLHAVSHRVVPDRLEVATFLAAVAVAGGEVTINDAWSPHMELFLEKLRLMGLHVTDVGNAVWVRSDRRLRSLDFATLPYPGIATDYKPLIVVMLSLANGTGIVTENLYAGRFRYVDELEAMGADIRVDGHHAVVRSVEGLRGADVTAHDIRAGACLVVAGLAAKGVTRIANPWHIDRGYGGLVAKLAALGADIARV